MYNSMGGSAVFSYMRGSTRILFENIYKTVKNPLKGANNKK